MIFRKKRNKNSILRKLHSKHRKGFTLIELVVGIAIFAVLVSGVFAAYFALVKSVKVAREKTTLTSLVSMDLEVVRNLPYDQVGTVNGNPSGTLPDQANPRATTLEGQAYRIYYEVTYIDDPADGTILLGTDSAPNDYKQVKMNIQRVSTGAITSVFTNVSPKGLESLSNAGALRILVFDAQGQPVNDASVHIENTSLNPDIILDRSTDASGQLLEVALPASINGYHIVVTKPGYSTDQTYPITAQNPNPIKPDSTIINGQVTQVSFSIDLLSNLTVRTLDQQCQGIDGVGVNIKGAKLIGTNPNVFKYNQNLTSSGGGNIAMSNIEWDTYTPTLLAGQNLQVYGTSPIQSITVLPGVTQVFTMILGQESTNSLLVIVKDAATGAALEGVTVHLRKGGSVPQDYYAISGGSSWTQNDWTGGSGQADFADATRYYVDDGNVDINSAPTGVRLRKTSGDYALSGTLESSTFDTGTESSNFTTFTWQPASQDPSTVLRFQVATNNDNATWNYKGPDGTAATYYTVPGSSVHSAHDNTRYVRYKAYLSTTDNKKTPVLTGLTMNYVSGCYTPGQSIFANLTAGNNYDLDVALDGYQAYVVNNLSINGNQVIEILMSH